MSKEPTPEALSALRKTLRAAQKEYDAMERSDGLDWWRLLDKHNALALDDFAAARCDTMRQEVEAHVATLDLVYAERDEAKADAAASFRAGYDAVIEKLRATGGEWSAEGREIADWLDANRPQEAK